jgi:hypothetical protein
MVSWSCGLVVVLATTACAMQRAESTPPEPSPSRAVVTISFPAWTLVPSMSKGNLWIVEGERLVGMLCPGRYVVRAMEPGLHELVAVDEFGTVATLRGQFEAGKHYRVRLSRAGKTTTMISSGTVLIPYEMYSFDWVVVEPGSDAWHEDETLKGLHWPVRPNPRSRRAARKAARTAARARSASHRSAPVTVAPHQGK